MARSCWRKPMSRTGSFAPGLKWLAMALSFFVTFLSGFCWNSKQLIWKNWVKVWLSGYDGYDTSAYILRKRPFADRFAGVSTFNSAVAGVFASRMWRNEVMAATISDTFLYILYIFIYIYFFFFKIYIYFYMSQERFQVSFGFGVVFVVFFQPIAEVEYQTAVNETGFVQVWYCSFHCIARRLAADCVDTKSYLQKVADNCVNIV